MKKKAKTKTIKTLKIHPEVKNKKAIQSLADKVGLGKVVSATYTLTKMGAKNTSALGYPDKFWVGTGEPVIIGDITGKYVSIYIEDRYTWFRTSPIVAVKKDKKNYNIETENSYYRLERV